MRQIERRNKSALDEKISELDQTVTSRIAGGQLTDMEKHSLISEWGNLVETKKFSRKNYDKMLAIRTNMSNSLGIPTSDLPPPRRRDWMSYARRYTCMP